MKNIILIILTITTFGCSADEIRLVGGYQVNLQPLIDWLAKPQSERGERPLKHWKEVRIKDWKETLSSWEHCLLAVEGGDKEVLFANLPSRISSPMADVVQLTATVKALKAQIASTKGPDGTSIYAERMRALAENEVRVATAQLAQAQEAVSEAKQKLLQVNLTVLAMSIGRKYGGVEIWDCGTVK